MKENLVIFAGLAVSLMLMSALSPAMAWEYYDTKIANPKTDNLIEAFGPRADKLQINMYSNELAEFTALETDQIDVMDWPVDATHYAEWTVDPLQQKIAVVDTGPEFGLYILDMRMDNRSEIASGVPNPAYNAHNGNPMANLALRRAIASICDRDYAVNTIISGGHPPALASALYTSLSLAYGVQPDGWGHPEINPTGALAQWCYVLANSSANVAGGLAWLSAAGYTYHAGGDYTTDPTGYKFTIDFYYRIDHTYRRRIALEILQPHLEAKPPNGLGMKGNLVMHGVTSAGGRAEVMDAKKGQMYTGGWGLTIDPDHLWYLFASPNYWHPGRPPNYMYYPGDGDMYTVPSDGWTYTGFSAKYGWGTSGLDFSDSGKTWSAGAIVWMNPQNYWSWEMMTATTQDRAKYCALKCQEFIAWYVCGVPIYASKSYTAFHRTYTSVEAPYSGQAWMGVVDQKGFGVWSTTSFYNMHTANAAYGNGQMTLRQGFRQPIMCLNPLYAEWVWDWYVMNNVYDSMISINPYTLDTMRNLADNWTIGTWYSPDYGTCTKITYHMREDLFWSDGMALTSSDVKFSWGGPLVTGSISNLLEKKGYPPAYWSSNLADMLSVATPDPWTVICYLDVYAYFGLHSMSGFNLVLPEHIWAPYINTPPAGKSVLDPFDVPSVSSSGWTMDHTWDPALHGNVITLSKNTQHFHVSEEMYPKNEPIDIWTTQESNATARSGNIHWIYPKSGETGVEINITVDMHTTYCYETGANSTEVHPLTRLTVEVNASLYIWNGTGTPSQEQNYDSREALILGQQLVLPRFQLAQLPITALRIKPWWYFVKIESTVTDLEFSTDNTTWIPVNSSLNPYFGMKVSYKDYVIVTSRYDFLGAYWKPSPPAKPKYQPIPDLRTNVKETYTCGMAYGSLPGYPNWNPVEDVNDDFKVDVKDYYKIAQNGGWIALYP